MEKCQIYFANIPEEAQNRKQEQEEKETTYLAKDPTRALNFSVRQSPPSKIKPPSWQQKLESFARCTQKCHRGTQKKSSKKKKEKQKKKTIVDIYRRTTIYKR